MPTQRYLRQRLISMLQAQAQVLREQRGLELPTETSELWKKVPDGIDAYHDNLPLLLVVPFNRIPFGKQIAAVNLKSQKPGRSYLNPDDMIDLPPFVSPPNPYLLVDVEYGNLTLGRSPEESFSFLGGQGRHAFTVNHGIALLLQKPEVLENINLHMSGTRMRDKDNRDIPSNFVPDFYRYADLAKLKRDDKDDADRRWGTPSYREIITYP